jgi:hypothetical protein
VKQHDDLKGKVAQARLSESLESRQKGAQFSIIDRANYPLDPATPTRRTILVVGLLLSVVVGAAAAIGAGIMSPRIWTQSELEHALETQVLVEIPKVRVPSDIRETWRRRVVHVGFFLVFAGVYSGGLYLLYRTQQPLISTLLTPLAERVSKTAN